MGGNLINNVDDHFDQLADELAWALFVKSSPQETPSDLLPEHNDSILALDEQGTDLLDRQQMQLETRQLELKARHTELRELMEDLWRKVDELVERVRRIDGDVSKLQSETERLPTPLGMRHQKAALLGPRDDLESNRPPRGETQQHADPEDVERETGQSLRRSGMWAALSRLWPTERNESSHVTSHENDDGNTGEEYVDDRSNEVAIRLASLRKKQRFRCFWRRDER